MNSYICAVSSLFPIDLAAVVMHHANVPYSVADQIEVSIVDDANVPAALHQRILAPQLALYSPIMVVDTQRTFRQVFFPLIENSSDHNFAAIERSTTSMAALLEQYGEQPATIEDIRNRSTSLVRTLSFVPGAGLSSASCLMEIARFVMRDILQREVEITKYVPAISGLRGQRRSMRAIARLAREVLVETGGGPFQFSRGGYIELTIDGGRQLELRQGIVDNRHVAFGDPDHGICLVVSIGSEPPECELSVQSKRYLPAAFLARLRGPLELIYQAERATLAHLPWYCETVSERAVSDFICTASESISPISVASATRASTWAGGSGYRLEPSGYSLIDYDHPVVRAYVSAIARIRYANNEDLSDWHHLLDNFPQAKQKAAKHQGKADQYCKMRLMDLRAAFQSGNTDVLVHLFETRATMQATAGLRALTLCAALRFMWDCGIPESGASWTDEQLRALQQIGLMSNGLPNQEKISPIAASLINEIESWIASVTRPAPEESDGMDAFRLYDQIAESRDKLRDHSVAGSVSVRKWAHDLERIAKNYYRCVLALCSSSLKAHVWLMWVLLGPRTYIAICQALLSKRGDRRLLPLTARLWERK